MTPLLPPAPLAPRPRRLRVRFGRQQPADAARSGPLASRLLAGALALVLLAEAGKLGKHTVAEYRQEQALRAQAQRRPASPLIPPPFAGTTRLMQVAPAATVVTATASLPATPPGTIHAAPATSAQPWWQLAYTGLPLRQEPAPSMAAVNSPVSAVSRHEPSATTPVVPESAPRLVSSRPTGLASGSVSLPVATTLVPSRPNASASTYAGPSFAPTPAADSNSLLSSIRASTGTLRRVDAALPAATGPAPRTSSQDLLVDTSYTAISASTVFVGPVYQVPSTNDAYNNVYVGYSGTGTILHSSGGTLTVGSRLYLGFNVGGNGTYDLSVGSLNTAYANVGQNGMGTFNQTGGSVTISSDGALSVGTNSGSNGTYTLSGAGSTLSAGAALVGGTGTGTFNQSGGTFTTGGLLVVGSSATGNGTYMLSGTGILKPAQALIGDDGVGKFIQTGGTFAPTASDGLIVGGEPGSNGTYTLSGTGSTLSTQAAYVGGQGTGTFNQSGGTFTTKGLGLVVGDDVGAKGTYNLSASGLLTTGYLVVGGGNDPFDVGGQGTGTFNQSGGTFTTGEVSLGADTTGGSGTYNLSGGTLTTTDVRRGPGTGVFNFNGGTLQASRNDNPGAASNPTTFMTGLSAANVQAGGAIIDTNGFNVTVAQTLSHDATLGTTADGGLTKIGAGTLTLGGPDANTYTGLTSVTGGTLVLNKTDGTPGDGIVAVSGNLSIGNATNPGAAGSAVVQLTAEGQTGNATNLTLFSDGRFDTNGKHTGVQNVTMTGGEIHTVGVGEFTINGNLTTNASATSALISSIDSNDNVELGEGTSTFTVARGTATYDLDVQAGVASGVLVKTGAGVLRLAGTTNGYLSVDLNAGTLAVASDTALGATPANRPQTFTLAGGTVTADGGDRTLANPVALTGSATVGASLDGTPRAITFTGATTLTGSQTLTVNNTATTTFAGAVNLNGANTLIIGGTGNTLISGVIGDGGAGGGLTKQGAGMLTLTGTNSYTGPTTVNAGILAINGVQTGTGMLSVASTATLAGTGSIAGAVQVQAGGTFSPGQLGAGRLTLQSSLTLTGAATASFTLGSTAVGRASTQALVGGQINLGTAATLSLTLASGYTPAVGDKFFLLDETGLSVVAGSFANAPLTGSLFTVNGVSFLIDYLDTDPNDPNHRLLNDVSVTVVAAVPEPSTCAWMLGGASLLGLTLLRRTRRPSALP